MQPVLVEQRRHLIAAKTMGADRLDARIADGCDLAQNLVERFGQAAQAVQLYGDGQTFVCGHDRCFLLFGFVTP